MEGRLYINGEWLESSSGSFEVFNPATGAKVGTAARATVAEATLAVEAADQAFAEWRSMPAKDRSELLYRWYQKVVSEQESIARLMTLEQGKPLREARGEVLYGADFILWYAEEAKRVYGETIPASVKHKRIQVLRQPVGPVTAITPWNFPAAMITRKIAPALAAGCTVVIKPAEQTPLTAIRLIELAHESGFPKGVINLITTDNPVEVGDVLTTHPLIRKVTFTGSTEIGKLLMHKAADTVKRVSMELGGHAPFLVFADADLNKAADAVVASKFRNAGQTCVCTNRVYVEKSVVDEFTALFAQKVEALRVGNGLEEGVDIGPLIDEQAIEKVKSHVADAVSKGASLVVGGKTLDEVGPGFFYQPTVLTGVTNDMHISFEETFGPVAPVFTFETEEEAIRMANQSIFGLAAYAFTNDLGRSIRLSEALEYGIVGINDPIPSTAQAPFGGFKQSGVGREGGRQGIEAFLETKYVSFGI